MREPSIVYNLEKMDGASESHRMDGFKTVFFVLFCFYAITN